MSTTLPYGRKLPANGDRGFWADLEDNIQRNDSHKHDGVDSALILTSDLSKPTGAIAAASWVSLGGGNYKQTVTTQGAHTVDKMVVKFYITNGAEAGHQFYPSIQKVTNTTYDIFINDNTAEVAAVYG